MSRINAFLELLINQNGSDLHLISGNAPRLRILGEVHPVKYRDLSEQETRQLLLEIMPARVQEQFKKSGNVDFAYELEGNNHRFRVNVFLHQQGIGAVFRAIPHNIPSIDGLGLPTVLKSLCHLSRGLILVTGPTGSGKSTTLAAMLRHINETRQGHIITIEDPVEFLHRNKQCLISQREIGAHTKSFGDALHAALREDPDVLLVGEMRDQETISMAVTAAEMGTLVLATLHTSGAIAAVDRIINSFPPGEEPYIRTMLSTSLCGVISQHLLPTVDKRDRIAALEILLNTPAAANIIREGKSEQLENVIQSGYGQGMQTIDGEIKRLLNEKRINGDTAYTFARNKGQFESFKSPDFSKTLEPETEPSVF